MFNKSAIFSMDIQNNFSLNVTVKYTFTETNAQLSVDRES